MSQDKESFARRSERHKNKQRKGFFAPKQTENTSANPTDAPSPYAEYADECVDKNHSIQDEYEDIYEDDPALFQSEYADEYYDESGENYTDGFIDEFEDAPSDKPHSSLLSSTEIEDYEVDLSHDEFGRERKPFGGNRDTKTRKALSWVMWICIGLAAAFLIRLFAFEIIYVDGESMMPTLQDAERVAVEKVSRYFSLPGRGDIVIVDYPDMDGKYVKRVIGLPGEVVEIKNNVVYINGAVLEEPYLHAQDAYPDMAQVIVPKDCVFVMGDNRAHSLDSRTSAISSLPRKNIVGHAVAVLWPFSNFRSIDAP